MSYFWGTGSPPGGPESGPTTSFHPVVGSSSTNANAANLTVTVPPSPVSPGPAVLNTVSSPRGFLPIHNKGGSTFLLNQRSPMTPNSLSRMYLEVGEKEQEAARLAQAAQDLFELSRHSSGPAAARDHFMASLLSHKAEIAAVKARDASLYFHQELKRHCDSVVHTHNAELRAQGEEVLERKELFNPFESFEVVDLLKNDQCISVWLFLFLLFVIILVTALSYYYVGQKTCLCTFGTMPVYFRTQLQVFCFRLLFRF